MHLILLNGPCAVGKSTIAALLHARLTGSYLLDIDALRRTIPNYRDQRETSARVSTELAQTAVRTHLRAKTSVIIDKMLSQPDVIDAFRNIATDEGATIHEFLLWAPKDVILRRAAARGYRPGSLLTPERCAQIWDRTNALRSKRPDAVVLDTSRMDADATLSKILARIAGETA